MESLAELSKARRRFAELETELAIHRRAAELLKEAVPPKARFAAIKPWPFIRAQSITALAQPDDGNLHRYQLTGLVICGLCGRAEGHWAYGRSRYRCRHGMTSSSDANPGRFPAL